MVLRNLYIVTPKLIFVYFPINIVSLEFLLFIFEAKAFILISCDNPRQDKVYARNLQYLLKSQKDAHNIVLDIGKIWKFDTKYTVFIAYNKNYLKRKSRQRYYSYMPLKSREIDFV